MIGCDISDGEVKETIHLITKSYSSISSTSEWVTGTQRSRSTISTVDMTHVILLKFCRAHIHMYINYTAPRIIYIHDPCLLLLA